MKCPQCKMIEMFVKNIEDGKVNYVCRKCGTTAQKEISKGEGEK